MELVWTGTAESLSSRPDCPSGRKISKTMTCGEPVVPTPSQPPAAAAHRSYLFLTTAALVGLALVCLAGCQTPRSPGTVPPPATGMIGQPAQYGSWATPPQGAAYPPAPSMPPMPGPATQWQGVQPASPPPSTWSWAQPAGAPPAMPPQAPPGFAAPSSQSISNQAQQFANQMQNSAQNATNQFNQNLNNQWQQMNGQMQQQANQAVNQAQQQANQYMNQAQQQANQYMNQGQQGLTNAQQQVTAQMPAYQQPYPPQYGQPAPPAGGSWNPFATSPQSLPPARATPVTTVPRY